MVLRTTPNQSWGSVATLAADNSCDKVQPGLLWGRFRMRGKLSHRNTEGLWHEEALAKGQALSREISNTEWEKCHMDWNFL